MGLTAEISGRLDAPRGLSLSSRFDTKRASRLMRHPGMIGAGRQHVRTDSRHARPAHRRLPGRCMLERMR